MKLINSRVWTESQLINGSCSCPKIETEINFLVTADGVTLMKIGWTQNDHTIHNHFTAPFSGTTRVSRRQKKTCLYGATEDNIGRHTDNPVGRHSIRTKQWPTSINPPIFTGDSLPAATLPIYPGLRQAPNMLVCIHSGLVKMTIQ